VLDHARHNSHLPAAQSIALIAEGSPRTAMAKSPHGFCVMAQRTSFCLWSVSFPPARPATGRAARLMLTEHPNLRDELRTEHHLMMQVPAERGESRVLEIMLDCGFDPNVRDHDGVTALPRAAMSGRADAVRVLLAHGASVNALDGMFAAMPLVWLCEGWSHDPRAGAYHLAVARLLLPPVRRENGCRPKRLLIRSARWSS